MAGTNVIFEAIINRWNQGGMASLVPNGISTQEPLEKTPRPYAILRPVGDTPKFRTNKGRYEKVVFSIELAFDNFEDVDAPATAIIDLLEEETLPVAGNVYRFVMIRQEGTIAYPPEDQYQRVVIPFEATISRGRFRGG